MDTTKLWPQLWESLKVLLTSKRMMIALLVAVFDVLALLGVIVPEASAETVATLVTTVGAILIGGISASDTGKALGKPPNVDHKDRGKPGE